MLAKEKLHVGVVCDATLNLNSIVFSRFECRNRRISNVFYEHDKQMNGHLHHVGQAKKVVKNCQIKPDQHVGLICWTTTTRQKKTKRTN